MEPLFAYIDPGSGSLVVQALIAALVAIPVFFRQQIGRAVRALRGTRAEAAVTTKQEDTTRGA